jgi:hypothetical protein
MFRESQSIYIESIIKDLNQIAGSTMWSISTDPTAGM